MSAESEIKTESGQSATPALPNDLVCIRQRPEVHLDIQDSVVAKWNDDTMKECIIVDIRSKGSETEYCVHIPDCMSLLRSFLFCSSYSVS